MSDTRSHSSIDGAISLATALDSLLTNERYHDVTLQGSDGVPVGANRSILAARSQVFDRLLMGNYSEAEQTVVPIGLFKGCVLQSVVQYAVTDKAQILDVASALKEAGGDINDQVKKQVKGLVSLTAAATYFHLPELFERSRRSLGQILRVFPFLSLEVLEACHQEGTHARDLITLALPSLIPNVEDTDFSVLSPAALKAILQDDYQDRDECTLFEILHLWMIWARNSGNENADNPTVISELVDCIRLERIDPHLLSTKVAQSRIVHKDQLYEVFKAQAIAAQGKGWLPCNSTFQKAIWKRSTSTVFRAPSKDYYRSDLVECRPMSGGLHEWSVVVERHSHDLYLGIAAPNDSFTIDKNNHCSVGGECYGWAYSSTGFARHAGHNRNSSDNLLPTFTDGCIVTFQLDLLPGAGRGGTLRASLDGGKSYFLLFDELKMFLLASDGFIPAAHLRGSSRIRFLYIKQLS